MSAARTRRLGRDQLPAPLGGNRRRSAISETATWLHRSEDEIRQAVAYYADFPDEIDEWIRMNEEAGERIRRRLEAEEHLIS